MKKFSKHTTFSPFPFRSLDQNIIQNFNLFAIFDIFDETTKINSYDEELKQERIIDFLKKISYYEQFQSEKTKNFHSFEFNLSVKSNAKVNIFNFLKIFYYFFEKISKDLFFLLIQITRISIDFAQNINTKV